MSTLAPQDAPPPHRPSLRPSTFRATLFGGLAARDQGLWRAPPGRAPRRGVQGRGGGAGALPLEAELAGLAGKVAELVRMHRGRLGASEPQIHAGLQDVANRLYQLSSMLAAGPPPPA